MGPFFPIFFSIAFWCSATTSYLVAQNKAAQNVLILGDSHLVGHFGEYFHRQLHETKQYDILSIAIGGAGSKHFVLPLRNYCCGYKIRLTCRGDSLSARSPVPTVEKAVTLTQELIGKKWSGSLAQIITYWQPDIAIIALGSNYVNAHRELISLFTNYSSSLPIIWIGPYKRKNLDIRIKAIEQALVPVENSLFIRSDYFIGHDSITSYHFYGKKAKNWAKHAMQQSSVFLDSVLTSSSQIAP